MKQFFEALWTVASDIANVIPQALLFTFAFVTVGLVLDRLGLMSSKERAI